MMMASRLQCENMMPVQVVDFSQLTSIFRLISPFFTPFLSHKGLVSRRLGRKQALFEAGGACTQSLGEQTARRGQVSCVSSVYRGGNPTSTEVNRRKPRYTGLTRFVIFLRSEGHMISEIRARMRTRTTTTKMIGRRKRRRDLRGLDILRTR